MVFYEKIWGKKEARMVRLERKLIGGYTMRVCIFRVACTLLAVISIVYLNFGIFEEEYTMRVCIFFCFSRRFLFHMECTEVTRFARCIFRQNDRRT